jgi:TonB family protein
MIRRALSLTASLALAFVSPNALRVEPVHEQASRAEPPYPNMFRVVSFGTFSVPRDLEAGEVLRLKLSGLGENHRLRLHRCGPGCETASTVATWDASQLLPGGARDREHLLEPAVEVALLEITIPAPGRYYLWIEDCSETSGAPGAVGKGLRAESARWDEQTLILRYGGGLEVIAEPVQAGSTAGHASPAAADSAPSTADPAELLGRASRLQAKGDLAAAADLFAQADRAAGGGSVNAVAGLCRTELELGRYVEAITAARRWIELAGTPPERAEAYHHLGLGLVQHGMDELYPYVRTAGEPLTPGTLPRSADRILGTEVLHQAADAFGRAAAETGGGAARLSQAAELVRREEYAEALAVLGDYAPAGGEGVLADELRCWAEKGVRKATWETEGGFRSNDVRAPIKVHAPPAQYTEKARKARVQGVVVVQAIIDEEGRVLCPRAATTLPEGLDAAAVAAVKQWRFRPATSGGKPVAVNYSMTVSFTLQ